MDTNFRWRYDEFNQVGKDYGQEVEVDAYDASHGKFRDVEAENRALLDRLDLEPDAVLIDIGAGTGAFAVEASKRCRMVYAVDVSEAMLARARANAVAAERSNVEFCHAGFLSYEHAGSKADVVTSSFSFHHLPDFWKGIALERIKGLLRSDGRLFIRDVVLQEGRPLEAIAGFIEKQAQLGGDFLREDAEGHFRDEFSTYDWVMRGLLERAGFRVLSETFFDGVIAEYLCEMER